MFQYRTAIVMTCLHHISVIPGPVSPKLEHCTPSAISQLLNILRITFSNLLATHEVAEVSLPLTFFITTTYCWNVFHLAACCKAAFGTICPGAQSYNFPDTGLSLAILQLQDIPVSPSSHLDGTEWLCSLVYVCFPSWDLQRVYSIAHISSRDVASISQKDTNSNMPAVGRDGNNHSWFEPDTQSIFHPLYRSP